MEELHAEDKRRIKELTEEIKSQRKADRDRQPKIKELTEEIKSQRKIRTCLGQ